MKKQLMDNKLEEVQKLEILSLMDNCVDFFSSKERKEVQTYREWTKKRYGQNWIKNHDILPFAEHGFSMLIHIFQKEKSYSIVFDTGNSPTGIIQNATRMRIQLSKVECIVLSHGHYDHSGGLIYTLKAINKRKIPVILHEDMFKTRGVINSDGTIRVYPRFPRKKRLKNAQLNITKKPSLIANNTVLISGEIPRKTSFEKGYLKHRVLVNGKWQPDPHIWDDRAIIINLKEKGLVIISGCAHAGIINTIKYAKKIAGISDIHAIIGGFHLTSSTTKNKIIQTVKEIQHLNPKIIIAAHCTGWQAKCKIATLMPKQFVWNSVGNLYNL